MYKRDYLMTILQELIKTIGRLLQHKEKGEKGLMFKELETTLNNYFNTDSARLLELSEEEIYLNLIDKAYAEALAELLLILGDEDKSHSEVYLKKALYLFRKAEEDQKQNFSLDRKKKIRDLEQRLGS